MKIRGVCGILLIATLLLVAPGTVTWARAQSADALINKLVDKGILTLKEAEELRQEADHKLTPAAPSKSSMPDWLTALRLHGDFRGRFEGFYSSHPDFVDRNRFRYRLRFGATALIKENFELGLRLTSSERAENFGGGPISANADFKDNASYKFVFLDRAYVKWTPLDRVTWSLSTTFGKMENPFSFFDLAPMGDSVFDPDYSPEGFSQQFRYTITDRQGIKLNFGEFILDEVGSSANDAFLFGAQLRVESAWTKSLRTSAGVTALAITGTEALLTEATGTKYSGVPNINQGNTRSPVGGDLANRFNPVVVDAGITYTLQSAPLYSAPFPVKVGGLFMHNPAASEKNEGFEVGVMFGRSGRKGLWDFSYRYKLLEADVWYEELVDSDFGAFYEGPLPGSGFRGGYGAGTNLRGHIFRASYSPLDALTIGITYLMVELIDEVPAGAKSDMGRLQVDAVWRF